jgi:hypothetical protein
MVFEMQLIAPDCATGELKERIKSLLDAFCFQLHCNKLGD